MILVVSFVASEGKNDSWKWLFLLLVRTPDIEPPPPLKILNSMQVTSQVKSIIAPPPPPPHTHTHTFDTRYPSTNTLPDELCSLILLHSFKKGQLIKLGLSLVSQSSSNYLNSYSHSTVCSSLLQLLRTGVQYIWNHSKFIWNNCLKLNYILLEYT